MEVETQVQKNLVIFCKYLPIHVDSWRSVLQEIAIPIQNLGNFSEQRRHVKRARIENLQNFDELQTSLLNQISNGIEEELQNIKEIVDKLNKFNLDLKNKLLIFERSTLSLDWEAGSEIVRGNGTQPSLSRLLQDSLAFFNFFIRNSKNIKDCFNNLNLDDEKSIREFQIAFNINLDDGVITSLISLTQYVDNAKAIL